MHSVAFHLLRRYFKKKIFFSHVCSLIFQLRIKLVYMASTFIFFFTMMRAHTSIVEMK
jgi:hypothetical protein